MNIQQAWCRQTSSDPKRWSEFNPALGQCAVTALFIQDILGGQIVRAETQVDGEILGSHYWNILPSGTELDLTKQQFADNVSLVNTEVRNRDYLMSHPDTARRYELLRKRVFDNVSR